MKLISKKQLKSLRKREKAAYPSFMRQMQHCYTWADLQDYCESTYVSIHFLGKNGYIILTENEVVDWVGDNQLFKMVCILKNHFKDCPFKVDLRESTSRPIVQKFAHRGHIQIKSVSSWKWEDETMIEAVITILHN